MSFLSLVFATLQEKNLYKKGMSTNEAVEIFNKLQGGNNKSFPDKREEKIKNLEEQLKDAKGIMARGKLTNEIDSLKAGFDDIEEYNKYQAEKRKEREREYEKEREEVKKKREEKEQKEAKEKEQYEKLKDFKFKNVSNDEKMKLLNQLKNKYGSKQELINKMKPLYHGGSAESVNSLNKNVEILSINEKEKKYKNMSGGNLFGLSTSTEKSAAQIFSKSRDNKTISNLYLSPDAKIFESTVSMDNLDEKEVYNLIEQGYDAIYDKENKGGENEMRVLNPSKIFTTSQINKL